MTDTEYSVLFFFIVVTLIINIWAILRITKNKFLSPKKKRLNLIFIWIAPLIWGLFWIIFSSKTNNKKKEDGYQYLNGGYDNYTKWGG